MNFKLLDDMINYIENHLIEEINYKKLAKIVGLPIYILQRTFHFITGVTIAEYVRKRRLSCAYEKLMTEKYSVTELAFMYGYSSSSAFTRSFKKYFKILPKDVKKSKNLLCYPKFVFDKDIIEQSFFTYKIKDMSRMTLYGKFCEIDDDNYVRQIYHFYKNLNSEGYLSLWKKSLSYGITILFENKKYYYVGSPIKLKGLQKFELPSLKYFIIENIPISQMDIVNTELLMHYSCVPSSSYRFNNQHIYELEIYEKDVCSIALPII